MSKRLSRSKLGLPYYGTYVTTMQVFIFTHAGPKAVLNEGLAIKKPETDVLVLLHAAWITTITPLTNVVDLDGCVERSRRLVEMAVPPLGNRLERMLSPELRASELHTCENLREAASDDEVVEFVCVDHTVELI